MITIADYLNAITSLIFIVISVLVGFTLVSKYFKSKDKMLIYVGIAWIIIVEAWMPSAINLIYMLITTVSLPIETRVIIGNLFIPFGIVLWTFVVTQLVFTKYKKLLVIIFVILGIVFEVIMFYSIFNDISLFVDISSDPLNTNYSIIGMSFQVVFSIITLVTGLSFSWKSIKHDNPEIKLRGKILFTAFTSFLIGSLFSIVDLYLIGSIFLITSSIFFYFGYILPDWIKSRFIK